MAELPAQANLRVTSTQEQRPSGQMNDMEANTYIQSLPQMGCTREMSSVSAST